MQEITGEIGDSFPSNNDDEMNPPNISSSLTKAYYYKTTPKCVDDPSDNINVAIQEAALVASERHSLDHLLHSNEDTQDELETQISQNSRMSIQNLLNPRGKPS